MTQLTHSLQLALGAVFFLAGATKLRRPRPFRERVEAYELLPARLVPPAAALLIVFEMLVGIALLTGHGTDLAIPVAIAILTIFLVAVLVTLGRGPADSLWLFRRFG